MSTRAQLRFVDEQFGENDGVQIYNHSDGYPSGIIPDLVRLRDVLVETGAQRDASYTAANFMFFGKLRALKFEVADSEADLPSYKDADELMVNPDASELLDAENFKRFNQPHALLGYGVQNVGQKQADAAWQYEVTFDASYQNRKDGDFDYNVKLGRGGMFEGDREVIFDGPLSIAHDLLEEAREVSDNSDESLYEAYERLLSEWEEVETPELPGEVSDVIGEDDPYAILGIREGASQSDIREAYREKVKEYHPDQNGTSEEFKKIQAAYEELYGA